MKLTKILTIISCFLFICIISTEASPRCNKACTYELNPTCGTLKRPNGRIVQCTFGNPCGVRVHACQTGEPWVASPGPCRKNSPECRNSSIQ